MIYSDEDMDLFLEDVLFYMLERQFTDEQGKNLFRFLEDNFPPYKTFSFVLNMVDLLNKNTLRGADHLHKQMSDNYFVVQHGVGHIQKIDEILRGFVQQMSIEDQCQEINKVISPMGIDYVVKLLPRIKEKYPSLELNQRTYGRHRTFRRIK